MIYWSWSSFDSILDKIVFFLSNTLNGCNFRYYMWDRSDSIGFTTYTTFFQEESPECIHKRNKTNSFYSLNRSQVLTFSRSVERLKDWNMTGIQKKKTDSNDIDTAAIEPSSHNYRTSRWSDYKRPCSQRTIMPALFSFWLLSLRPLPITLKRSQTGRSVPLSTSSRGRTRKTYPLDSILTLLHDASTRTWHWRVPSAGSLVGSRTVDVEYEWFR